MDSPIPQMGLGLNHKIQEKDISDSEIADNIGIKWKDLARALGFKEATIEQIENEKGPSTKECCIQLLVRWLRRKGMDATAGKLAEVLKKIELKNLADSLTNGSSRCERNCCQKEVSLDESKDSNNPNQAKHERLISKMSDQLDSLKEEVSNMAIRITELEEKISTSGGKYPETEQEVSKIAVRIGELEDERLSVRQKYHETEEEVDMCELMINKMSDQLNDQLASVKQEVNKMSNRIKELADNLSRAKQKCRDTEEENLSLRAKIKALEDTRQPKQESFQVVDTTESFDTERASVVSSDTDDAARESHIGKTLEKLNERLITYVTSPLQVPEVKQDKLKTPIKLDLLTRLSERLQELYSKTLIIVTETCKCSEDLKKDFYDFAYHGLRAEHNELVHRVKDLESALPEMSFDEEKDFERLQGFQVNRQRQCERLDKLWRGLFSPPERLPKAPCSAPTAANGKTSKKKLLRRTDPGARPKRTKPRDQRVESSEAFSTGEDDNSQVRLNAKLVKNIFRKKEDESVSSSVPYLLMRDS